MVEVRTETPERESAKAPSVALCEGGRALKETLGVKRPNPYQVQEQTFRQSPDLSK